MKLYNRSSKTANFGSVFKRTLSLLVAMGLMATMLAAIMQQQLRQDANWPQVQLAQDLATNKSAPLPETVDVSKSLGVFVIRYNTSGKVVASTARLNGATPQLPSGVLDNVKRAGSERLTWQPTKTVRIAAVVYKADDGFVLAGRSLREVEQRKDEVMWDIFLGLVTSWLIVLGVAVFVSD